jgi:uncharacterized membrane protein YhaH (DUF805 family)
MIQEVKHSIVRFDDFKGRSTRTEYWGWHLLLITILAAEVFLDPSAAVPSQAGWVALAVLQIPTIAVGWRRMHDIGMSGWWHLVPIVNWVLATYPSNGDNEYGPAHIEPGHSNLTGGPAYI